MISKGRRGGLENTTKYGGRPTREKGWENKERMLVTPNECNGGGETDGGQKILF